MPCKIINGAIICYNNCYRYKSIYFEFGEYTVPKRLNKNGEISQKGEGRKFWTEFNEWLALPEKERKKYLVEV
jgi:hypothetical protein